VILQITNTLTQSSIPLHNPPLGGEEAVTRENGLLEVLTENGQLQATLVGNHPDMVQMLLSVVQHILGVAEVAAEGRVRYSLVGEAIGIDPPVVLIARPEQLVVVVVDEA
jgi:hypothetical protein